ncbi:F420-dependent oxidoreductase-like protein [Kribbella sp. VKM Ac-2527]|uniref:F420-dependent oxidoreductase-like protein n=1 Tax=Kribbella caucasensis TaxID=2512215 RepID=A0A4V3CAQ0_9ACTN|nr:LLM class F420-dependent oxidoreductase [Kribbella sp. VKM Ac-2527]TDO51742.1 F420-dependent oxidoreductase-like protein [Kribbella sp. VKM Ac-2527]
MRFGLFIPQGWRHDLVGVDPADQWAVMRDLASAADSGPWESLWVYDHFHTIPVPSDEPTHEAWTLMAAFAASTERIRLGQMCTCMSYRNPAYLAKVAATVDHVSGGRLDFGIGGGWYEHEWLAYGYGFPSAGERLARLREGVEIMRQAWTTGTATLAGKHYQVDGAIVRPLPRQAGGIPIWVAGGGEKVTLRIAAKYAAYTNFGGDPETFTRKSEILRGHCADLGTDFDAITQSMEFHTIIGATEAEATERRRAIEARLLPVLGEANTASAMAPYDGPQGLVGTPEQAYEKLVASRDLGMGYAIHYFPESAYDRSGVELFEREVIPALA